MSCRRWLASCLLIVPITHATKHTFHVSTGRNLIGPIGVPFGFNVFGDVKLHVETFQLDPIEAKGGTDQTSSQVEAGFLLRRFKNEADFNQFMDVLQTNSTECAFEAFRDEKDGGLDLDVGDDFPSIDGDNNDNRSIQSAKDGVFLSMNSNDRSIEYRFKK
jgi:hypothetical protein